MPMLIDEINELRQMLSNFKAGTLSPEDMMVQLAVYSQTEKRTRHILFAWSLALKHNITGMNAVANELVGDAKSKIKKIPYDRTKDRGK